MVVHVTRALARLSLCFIYVFGLLAALSQSAMATPFTTTVPATGVALPDEYPEAGGIAIVLTGTNGNIYYQFSDPNGAFIGFQYNGQPAAFRGNPFTINNPLTLNCGFRSCTDYFGGSIARVDIRFSAYDGDTQPNGFDEDDISLRLNGFNVGSWSGLQTEITNNDGTQSFGFATGFGNNTFNTAWFSSTNSALLNNILTTGQTLSQVFDDDPNDNYWDFTRGPSLPQEDLRTIAPGYEFDKTLVGGATTFLEAGQVLTYEYLVSNIGSVDIEDITVVDDKIPNVMCPAPPNNSLPRTSDGASQPNSLTCTGTYTVTQDDVDAGELTNIAVANGEPEFGELGAVEDTITLTGPAQVNGIALEKDAGTASFTAPNDVITYTFTVENTGNTTLTNVSVSDPRIPGLSCTFASILPLSAANTDNTETCTGTYTTTQADVDAFATAGTTLDNTATVSATAPDGSTQTDTATESLTGPAAAPALTIAKTANQPDFDADGDVLDFQITVRNTGNVTWPGPPAITDALTGGASCPAGAVAPGAQIICTASYTVDQDDVDAGFVENIATADITVGGASATGTADVTVNAVITPALDIVKRLQAGSPTPYDTLGQQLIYEYVLTNSGNVTITGATIDDDLVTASCPATSIAPGGSLVCTSDPYIIDQDDLNDGSVTNTASGSGDLPQGGSVTSADAVLTVNADQDPSMTMVKTAPAVDPIDFTPGFVVTYTYDVTNDGNVTLAGPINVVDDRINGGTPFLCDAGPVAPMAAIQCTADYTVTPADVTDGFVTNSAFATDGTTTSNTDSATIPQSGTPAITVDKTALTASFDDPSDVLSYSFEFRNTGDVTIVALTNPLSLDDPDVTLGTCIQPPFLFPEGSAQSPTSFTCSGTFNGLTQAEMDAGEFINTATASFPYTDPTSGASTTVTSAPSSATVPADITPAFAFTKISTDDFSNVGDTVTYTFTVTNQTAQSLTQVVVTDPLIPGLSCTLTNIPGFGMASCSGDYVVDQDDLDAGQVDNTATATGTSPLGVTVTETDDETVTIDPAAQTRSLDMVKTATQPTFVNVGDLITYTMAVENTGNLTATNIVVTDPDLGLSCVIPTLAPLAIDNSCSGSRAVTQDDIDAGSYTNTASVTATGIPAVTAMETVNGPVRDDDWVFTKSADASFSAVGDMVRFTMRIENTGNVTLTNVVLTDTFFDPDLVCSIGDLAPGAIDNSCTQTYTVTQADVDAGSITNAAEFDANGVGGAPVSDTTDVTIPGPARVPSLSVSKLEEDGNNGFVLNVPEFYTFTIENTGNVTLTNVQFDDPLTGQSCTLPDMDPGDVVTSCDGGPVLRASYTPDQDDVDAGSLTNVATVTADTPPGVPSISQTDELTLQGPDQLPAISMVKTATSGQNFSAVGDVITYDYVVTNDGNITIDQPITVVDNLTTVTCPSPPESFGPGQTSVCTASYTVTQDDLDAGQVVNLATADVTQPVVPSATHPTGAADITSGQVSETVAADQMPELSILKRIRPGTPTTFDAPGDLADAANPNNIIFEFLVTNEGNVTTTAPITVADTLIPANITCEAGPVAPGDTVICSALWAPEQSDVDAGSFTNSATASTVFDGGTVTTPVPGDATAFAIQRPELTILKEFQSITTNTFDVGETITYQFTVTNTGNTTITDQVTINDNLTGPITCGAPGLALGASVSCTGTYVVTQGDFDLGSVANTATATDGTTTSDPSTEIVPTGAMPAISLDKVADPVPTATQAGDMIRYAYTITNTSPNDGGVTTALGPIFTIDDDKIGTFTCDTGPRLRKNDSFTCFATYTVTQADVDNVAAGGLDGQVVNNATATTIFGGSPVVSPSDQVVVPLTAMPLLELTKTAANLTDPGQPADADDTLEFTIEVRNSGNQTISNLIVTDPMLTGLSCTGGGADPMNLTLAPNAVLTCTGTYVVEQDDLDGQSISNTAEVTGSTQQGGPVGDTGSTTYPVAGPMPLLSVSKDIIMGAAPTAFSDVGETIQFRVTVENIGNITVGDINVTDSLIPGTCAIGTLAPGEEDATCVFDYLITQDDIDAGQVENTATATGTPETGGSVTGTGTEIVGGPDREPAIGIAKEGTGPLPAGTFDEAGQTISYLYTVANLGNVTLTETPVVTDNLIPAADITCDPMPVDGLRPTEELQCRADYVTSQDDVDRGFVTNTAVVDMVNEYGGPPLIGTIDATVPSERAPAMTIAKIASDVANVMVDDVLTYTYTITNTGNVRLFDVTLDDQHTSASGTTALTIAGSPVTVMQPDEVVTLTATYTVTQEDIDAGAPLTNTVTATSTSPPGTTPPTATDDETVALEPSDGMLEVIKTLPITPAILEPGVDLVFEVTVQNTGNVTLSAPSLTDTVTQVGGGTPAQPNPVPVFQSGDAGQVGLLDVGETWTYEVTYQLTQADVDAGGVQNAVVATATDPSGTPVSDTSDNGAGDGDDPTVVPIVADGLLEVIKTVRSTPADPVPGDTLVFEVTVANIGNVTLMTPVLDDDLTRADGTVVSPDPSAIFEGGDTADPGQLNVGETWTYRVEHVFTQADIDAGGLSNSVTATANDPSGTPVSDVSDNSTGDGDDPTSISINALPALEVLKTVSGPVPARPVPNDVVSFEVAVENTGNVTLTAPVLTDTLTPNSGTAISPAPVPQFDRGDTDGDGRLGVGEIWVYVLDYPISQEDIDAGGFANSVFAEADDPSGTPVDDTSDNGAGAGSDPTEVTLAQDPQLEAVKTILNTPMVAGDTVLFEIAVQNTGNVTLSAVDIASDTLTRADATPLALATGPDYVSANMGSPEGSLLAAETAIYRATYVLVQEDIDAGGIANTATAAGTPPSGPPVTDVSDNGTGDGDDPTELSIPPMPAMELLKRLVAGGPTFDAVGDVLSYEFDVTNTGNVTLGAISIVDPLITDAGGTITCPPTLLIPDAMLTCTADYAVVQADIDAGQVTNTAEATDGATTSDPDSVTVLAQQLPALETIKDAVSITVDGTVFPGTPSERYIVGAVVSYEYTVTNTGNTTITDPISVSDNLIANVSCPALPAGGLAPMADIVCTADYTVTADDVAITSVTNLASATDGTTTSDLVSETVPADGVPALEITKTLLSVTNPGGAVDAGQEYDEVGDVLTYQFEVTNAGEVSFAQPVNVQDDFITGPIACFTPDAANPDLIPGESVICEASYTVSQDDLDAGDVTNTAFAETMFGDGRIVVSDPVMETALVAADPRVELSKSAATLPVTTVGQVLTYTLVAENTGNQTLRQVIVTDPLLPGLVCEAAMLAPGASLTCSEEYTVTQDDVDAGEVVNTAAVAAINPLGGSVEDDVVLVTAMPEAAPGIDLVKTATPEPFGVAGSTIAYRFAVENTGNVTLFDVVVTDEIVAPAYTCTIPRLDVGVTDTVSCVLNYTVTQDDVDDGEILNTATVEAVDPFGQSVDAAASLSTQGTAQAPRLTATKAAVLVGDGVAGSVIDFTLTVVNTGNVTLAVTDIVDTMTRADGASIVLDAPFAFVGGDSNGDGRLGLTEEWIYTASYTLVQADIDAGGVDNTATVNATAPDGTPISDVTDDGIDSDGNTSDDVTEIRLQSQPLLSVIKTLRSVGAVAGDEVIFDIDVRNAGNVTLTDIAIADTMTNAAGTDVSAGVSAPVLLTTPITVGALAPREVWTYEVRYTLTQADVDAGGLSNSAVAGGTTPTGDPVTDTSDSGDPADGPGDADPTSVVIEAAPALEAVKTALPPVRAGEGLFDVTFTLAAENTGNVTLSDVSMVDDLVAFAGNATLVSVTGLSDSGFASGGVNAGFDGRADTETLAPGTSLAPGDVGQVVFTVRLDVSSAGTDNDNVVTATADRITGEVSASVSLDPLFEPNVEVTKTVSPSTAIVGDVITYTITVNNSGDSNEVGLRIVDEMPSGLAFVPGSARVDGSETPLPVLSGRSLIWAGIDVPSGTTTVITLQARVVDGPGALTNRAYAQLSDGTLLSNIAEATLQVRPEAVFHCGDVIGRVFDDRNMNGYQDGASVPPRDPGVTDQTYDGGKFDAPPVDEPRAEAGLPGVRLATVDGDVITTDEYGRFSVPCALLPASIGSNFVLKLDETSLPTGYQMTSENPRMIRLTPGTMAQMNFGAALADIVDVTLTAAAFDGNAPSAGLTQGVAQLVAQMSGAPTVLRLGYYTNGEGRDIARARLDMVEDMIREQWRSSGSGRDLIVERTIAEVQ